MNAGYAAAQGNEENDGNNGQAQKKRARNGSMLRRKGYCVGSMSLTFFAGTFAGGLPQKETYLEDFDPAALQNKSKFDASESMSKDMRDRYWIDQALA